MPAGVDQAVLPLLAARSLRAFVDGFVAVLLPAYLLSLGLGTLQVGVLSTATMLGSAFATLAVGVWGHRFASARLLRGAGLLIAATGVGFSGLSAFRQLLVVAFFGTLNPSSGDVSVFLPLEHSRLAGSARAMFVLYALTGVAVWWLYHGTAAGVAARLSAAAAAAPLGPSRRIVLRLAAYDLVLWRACRHEVLDEH